MEGKRVAVCVLGEVSSDAFLPLPFPPSVRAPRYSYRSHSNVHTSLFFFFVKIINTTSY